MRNIPITLLLLLLANCSSPSYNVQGTTDNPELEGQYVRLVDDYDDRSIRTTDNSVRIADGKFELSGDLIPEVALYTLELPELREKYPPVKFVAEKGQILIQLDSVSVVGGTPRNIAYQKVVDKERELAAMDKVFDYTVNKYGADADETRNVGIERGKAFRNRNEEVLQFASDNIGNGAGVSLLTEYFESLPLDRVDKLLAKMPKQLDNHDTRRMKNIIQVGNEFVPGVMYRDGEAKNLVGDAVRLSHYMREGQCTLYIFWASWCQPYVDDIPKLEKIYAKYKTKGYEVVAISVDNSSVDWKLSVEVNPTPWVQLIDSDRQLSYLYGLYYYPHTLLFDREGRLVAKDLRGDLLDWELDNLLNLK